jgi:hypothetical protein
MSQGIFGLVQVELEVPYTTIRTRIYSLKLWDLNTFDYTRGVDGGMRMGKHKSGNPLLK